VQFYVLCHPSVRARSAAGITWTSRTTSAPWAARNGHTSVVDAAGAIYVIGGYSGTSYRDVWASTDGGADWTKSGVVGGYWVGTTRVLRGVLRGYYRGIKVYEDVPRRTKRVLERYSRGL
jgi:hypothetical protein